MPSSPAPRESSPAADAILPSMRTWFRVHCAIDVAAAIPLLLLPARVLRLLGWTSIDPVASRLCGAALLGIGAASVMVDRYGLAGYRALLGLKVVWSLAAVFACVAGIGDGAPDAAWAFLSIFIAFAGVWTSFAIRLRRMERAGLLNEATDDGEHDSERADQDDQEAEEPG